MSGLAHIPSHALNKPHRAVLAITYTNAAALQLDREPLDSATLSFFEVEDRRRVWWNLYYVSVFSASLLGGAWSPISLKEVTTRLPLDCSDVEVMTAEGAAERTGEESSMSSVLCKMQLSVLVQSIVGFPIQDDVPLAERSRRRTRERSELSHLRTAKSPRWTPR